MLSKEQLLAILDRIAPSKQDGLSDAAFDRTIDSFCAGCPDPASARRLLLDCLDPLTDEELVERALGMPPRSTGSRSGIGPLAQQVVIMPRQADQLRPIPELCP